MSDAREKYLADYSYSLWCRTNDNHVEYVCTSAHTDGSDVYCQFCEGGLFACSVCNAFEGATPSECPGVRMTADQSDAVYAGKLDYRAGRWVQECTVHMIRPPHGEMIDWPAVEQYAIDHPYSPPEVPS